MTRNRHAQAAARSTPYGTCPRARLVVPGSIGSGTGRRSARAWTHWLAKRSPRRGGDSAAPPPSSGSPLTPDTLPGPASVTGQPLRQAVRRVRLGSGQQPDRAQRVVVVDHDAGSARQLPAPFMVGTEAVGEHPVDHPGPAVPQHAAGADQQVDLAQVLAGALEDPALRADHDAG